ncbi:MAG: hypothetical protein PVF17_04475 [Ignavibacteria bacterium]|jgi:hypothetical protein
MRYKVYLCNPNENIDHYHILRFDITKNTGFYMDINNFAKYYLISADWGIKYAKETDFNNFVFSYNTKEEAIEQYNQFKENNPELFI